MKKNYFEYFLFFTYMNSISDPRVLFETDYKQY